MAHTEKLVCEEGDPLIESESGGGVCIMIEHKNLHSIQRTGQYYDHAQQARLRDCWNAFVGTNIENPEEALRRLLSAARKSLDESRRGMTSIEVQGELRAALSEFEKGE